MRQYEQSGTPLTRFISAIVSFATASLAFSAAMCGASVFATMQLNDAVSALSRLFLMGVEPFMVTAALKTVINQRLVRLNCPHCAAPEQLEPDRAALLESRGMSTDRVQVGRGCEECGGTGVLGRKAIVEVLALTPELNDLVLQGASADELQDAAVARGMRTLRHQALALAEQGTISLAEALRATPPGR